MLSGCYTLQFVCYVLSFNPFFYDDFTTVEGMSVILLKFDKPNLLFPSKQLGLAAQHFFGLIS